MALPAPQTAMITIAGLAQFGSASQAGPLMPSARSAVLIRPLCPLYIHIHRMLPATIGINEGKKKMVRYKPTPFTLELSKRARLSETSRPSETEPVAKQAVFHRLCQNNGSL